MLKIHAVIHQTLNPKHAGLRALELWALRGAQGSGFRIGVSGFKLLHKVAVIRLQVQERELGLEDFRISSA